jgi:hypothetical protein
VLGYYDQVDDKYPVIHTKGKIINGEDKSLSSQITILRLLNKSK